MGNSICPFQDHQEGRRGFSLKRHDPACTHKQHSLVEEGNEFPSRMRKVPLIPLGTLVCKELRAACEYTFTEA